jgi:hypothetical protein
MHHGSTAKIGGAVNLTGSKAPSFIKRLCRWPVPSWVHRFQPAEQISKTFFIELQGFGRLASSFQ